MIWEWDAVKFSAKCRDCNRQYEQNNNQEVDNGVYNQFESSDSNGSQRSEVDEVVWKMKIWEESERCIDLELALTPLEIASKMEIKEEILDKI